MKTSPAGRLAIEQREGYLLKAYRDSRGIPTIGVGHTGPEVKMGSLWTIDKVNSVLEADLQKFEDAVNGAVKASLSQNEFDACVSLAFNIGVHGFVGSSVVKQINAGNMTEAANDFLMWEKPSELRKRREGERAQFLGIG